MFKNVSRQVKITVLLAVSQAVCLAVGIWIQYRCILVLVRTNEEARLGVELPGFSEEITKSLVSMESVDSAVVSSLPLAFCWIAGLQTVAAYLVLMPVQTEHKQKQSRAQEAQLVKAKELVRTRDAVIFGLAKLAESRDVDTGHHLDRISQYAECLATELRKHSRFRAQITPSFIRTIGIGSALHDIGKVGVSDQILHKPGKLTSEERVDMERHTTIGGECIRQIEQRLGNSSFLAMARDIAYCHHERWDGTGYPANLKGEEIPLAARIVAIVDVYDALVSRRSYKEAYPHEMCVSIIREERGTHFDPNLVDVFLSVEQQFEKISSRYQESRLDPDTYRPNASQNAVDFQPDQNQELVTTDTEDNQSQKSGRRAKHA